MATAKKQSRGGQSRYGGGDVDPNDIVSESDMIVEHGNYQTEIDDVLSVSKDLLDIYGQDVPLQQFFIAEMRGKGKNVLGYYDGANIAINERFLDTAAMNKAYEECVKAGFHPNNGNKSGMQAVVAHEFGHAATDAVARKMGLTGTFALHSAADRIVGEAAKATGHRGVVKMAAKISRYATHSNAEAVAEAFADVYCNGKKATKESQAIVNVMNKYLKS